MFTNFPCNQAYFMSCTDKPVKEETRHYIKRVVVDAEVCIAEQPRSNNICCFTKKKFQIGLLYCLFIEK